MRATPRHARPASRHGARRDPTGRPLFQALVLLTAGVVLGVGAFWAYRRVEKVIAHPPRPPVRRTLPPQPVSRRLRKAAHFYDFYELLKGVDHVPLRHPEVIDPARDRHVVIDRDLAPVRRPGRYILQVASFRHLARAQEVVAHLALLGLAAHVDRVTLPDGQVWHRVRLGPLTDLARLNRVRNILAAHHYHPLLMTQPATP